MPYLVPGDQRDRHLAAVSAAGAELTWSRTADELAAVYRRASTGRSSESRALLEAFLEDRSALVESRSQVEQSYYAVRREYDKDAEGLVGPNGVIPSDTRQALLAVGSRPVLSRPVFGLIRWLYGLGNRSRRRRPPSPE
jgi:hypothetical protein